MTPAERKVVRAAMRWHRAKAAYETSTNLNLIGALRSDYEGAATDALDRAVATLAAQRKKARRKGK
jgi:hypothetical protein